ncbi:unnamed protein product [Allacma fusca]|uniref:OTU domain-containing protein n=1 Tax=Allacma fusca TaxID=39272 RepID=A0A8J2KPX5_9HEXA|nr:unnamed protein product [Allacma fusca]
MQTNQSVLRCEGSRTWRGKLHEREAGVGHCGPGVSVAHGLVLANNGCYDPRTHRAVSGEEVRMNVPSKTSMDGSSDPEPASSKNLCGSRMSNESLVVTDHEMDSGHCWKFRIVPNDIEKFSGDCLFMAISQFLLPEYKPCSSLQFHSVIRETIVSFLTHNEETWRRYSIWLKNNHQARIKEFKNYLPDSPCRVLHNKIQKAYKRSMLTGGYFGTMAELNAAMELFGFRTTLIQEDLSDKQFSVYNIGDTCWHHQMYLLFTGHSDGGHFQLLELLSEQEEAIPTGKFQVISFSQQNFTITLSQVKMSGKESLSKEACLTPTKRVHGDETKNEDSRKRRKNNDSLLEMNSDTDETNLTKTEMCQLRTVFMSDFSTAVATDAGDVSDGGCGPDGGCNPEATIPFGLTPLPPVMKDSSIYYVYLPPWSGTTFQMALENTVVEIMEKSFALLDSSNAKHERRTLSLKQKKFVVESEDLSQPLDSKGFDPGTTTKLRDLNFGRYFYEGQRRTNETDHPGQFVSENHSKFQEFEVQVEHSFLGFAGEVAG